MLDRSRLGRKRIKGSVGLTPETKAVWLDSLDQDSVARRERLGLTREGLIRLQGLTGLINVRLAYKVVFPSHGRPAIAIPTCLETASGTTLALR